MKITIYGKIQTIVLLLLFNFLSVLTAMFCLYETFNERSREQLKIAKSEQMNVEISANI